MWEENHPQVSPFTTFLLSCKAFCRFCKPTLRTVGQCLFGLAMLFLIAGIALCIWGYLGTAITPFQLFGPICIGLGIVIYVIGCILCCKEYPDYDTKLKESQRKEAVTEALKTLKQVSLIQWMQGEPEIYEEFKELATRILNTNG